MQNKPHRTKKSFDSYVREYEDYLDNPNAILSETAEEVIKNSGIISGWLIRNRFNDRDTIEAIQNKWPDISYANARRALERAKLIWGLDAQPKKIFERRRVYRELWQTIERCKVSNKEKEIITALGLLIKLDALDQPDPIEPPDLSKILGKPTIYISDPALTGMPESEIKRIAERAKKTQDDWLAKNSHLIE